MVAMTGFKISGALITIVLVAISAICVGGQGLPGNPIIKPPVVAPVVAPLAPEPFAPAPEPTPLWPPCDGVDIVYSNMYAAKIYPFLNDTPWLQPYRFESVVTVTNMGYSTVEGWAIGIDFQHHEIIVDAEGIVLEDGRLMPVDVSNGTVLTQIPAGVLKNAIETAGDMTQVQKSFIIKGTEFGKKLDPMPLSINITQKGYNCSEALLYGNNTMHTCCSEPNRNITLTDDEFFLHPEAGNFTITYDVTQAYPGSYLAHVTISNDSPIARLDFWNISFTWQENEFITKMLGATTREADREVCLNGIAGKTYTDPDMNTVLSCSVSPEIIDLPLEKFNDTQIGRIEYCCRNGSLWPALLDEKKSKSAFIMNVFKVPPMSNQLNHIVPPGNWRIGDGRFKCGVPRRIKPTAYPDPYVLHETTAFKTWQVTCNETDAKPPPKCCVSFSKYTNDSIVPCRTCACGCPANPQPACNPKASAMLLPYSAITMHPENRTRQILAWADINHNKNVPTPLPCQDYCGVAINWHVVSNFTGGWSSRMTLFDWSDTTYPEWFTVLQMTGAYEGFQQAYSFNATRMTIMNGTAPDNTSIMVTGLEGLNYLMSATNRSAGKLQSVFSFTKVLTPNMRERDYFPEKVWFNGEECAMPEGFPLSSGAIRSSSAAFGIGLLVIVCNIIFLNSFSSL